MADKKLSLAELMGANAADRSSGGIRLHHLPEILGEAMPELPKNPVGRHRLVRALQQRFGRNFRSLPGIKDVMSEFDREISLEIKVAQMKQIRARRSNNG